MHKLYENMVLQRGNQDDIFATIAHRCVNVVSLFSSFLIISAVNSLLAVVNVCSAVGTDPKFLNSRGMLCGALAEACYRAITNGTQNGNNSTGKTTQIILRSQYVSLCKYSTQI